jgi:hypothetical protein
VAKSVAITLEEFSGKKIKLRPSQITFNCFTHGVNFNFSFVTSNNLKNELYTKGQFMLICAIAHDLTEYLSHLKQRCEVVET